MDPEDLSRPHLVALDLVQHAPHVAALQFLERHRSGLADYVRKCSAMELLGQVMRMDDIGFGQDSGALDGIFEFADIARPWVIDKQAHCALGKAHRGPPRGFSYLRRKWFASNAMSSLRSRRGGN